MALVLLSFGCTREKPPHPQAQDLLVVLNKAVHTATVIDVDSGRTRGTLATGVAPHEAAGDSAGGKVVVSNYGTQENAGFSLTVLDIRRMRVSRTIPLGRFRRPHGIQFFHDGVRVAVTTEDSQAVLVVNIRTGRVEKAIPTTQRASHMLVLSPDDKQAYVANIRSGSISVLEIDGSRLLTSLPIGEGVEGLALSPDGRELWVANRLKNELVVIDTDSLKIAERIPCAEAPIRVCFTPDGADVMASNSRSGDLAVFSAAERREIARIPMALTPDEKKGDFQDVELAPVPSGIIADPRGKRAFVASTNANLVTEIDTENWAIAGRFHTGREPEGMALVHLLPLPASVDLQDPEGQRGTSE
jgi:YVTN family beta-propeller protein